MAEDFREILRRQAGNQNYLEHGNQPLEHQAVGRERRSTMLPAVVAAVGGGLITISPALPWLHVTAPLFGSLNFSLLDGLSVDSGSGIRVLVPVIFVFGGLAVIFS